MRRTTKAKGKAAELDPAATAAEMRAAAAAWAFTARALVLRLLAGAEVLEQQAEGPTTPLRGLIDLSAAAELRQAMERAEAVFNELVPRAAAVELPDLDAAFDRVRGGG